MYSFVSKVTSTEPEDDKRRTLERVSTALSNAKDPEDPAKKDPRIESVTNYAFGRHWSSFGRHLVIWSSFGRQS